MGSRLFLLGLLAACVAISIASWPRGVRVVVTNRGPQPLADVVIYVTGNEYRLGTLGVGETRTMPVQAQGESTVKLEFTGGSGEQLRFDADVYFETTGYEGTIEIELEAGAIVRSDNRVGLWPFGG